MNCSRPGLPVHHQLQEFTQTHVHRVGDAIQPSHPLSSPSPPAPNPSQHQSLFQWVNFAWGVQSTGVSDLASFLPKKSQGWSSSEWTGNIGVSNSEWFKKYSQSYGFPSSYVQMWEMDHREGWALKNWCFWIMVLEKTLESPLDSKEIKPVNPKGH